VDARRIDVVGLVSGVSQMKAKTTRAASMLITGMKKQGRGKVHCWISFSTLLAFVCLPGWKNVVCSRASRLHVTALCLSVVSRRGTRQATLLPFPGLLLTLLNLFHSHRTLESQLHPFPPLLRLRPSLRPLPLTGMLPGPENHLLMLPHLAEAGRASAFLQRESPERRESLRGAGFIFFDSNRSNSHKQNILHPFYNRI
jgi:hypothetical protein